MTIVSMMTNVSMNLKRFNCLDELARDKRLDEGVAALLTWLGPLERLERDNEYGRLDTSRAWQHSWYVLNVLMMASAVWYSFFDLAVPQQLP